MAFACVYMLLQQADPSNAKNVGKEKTEDIWMLDQVLKAEKVELLGMLCPFWKRPKIEPIEKTRRKLAQMLSSGH
jgi:hypothetical protein